MAHAEQAVQAAREALMIDPSLGVEMQSDPDFGTALDDTSFREALSQVEQRRKTSACDFTIGRDAR
jgi:hypothetical protein